VHDTVEVILDLAVALAVGGYCPADLAVLRGQPRLLDAVASDATVFGRVQLLAADVEESVAAIRGAPRRAYALRLRIRAATERCFAAG